MNGWSRTPRGRRELAAVGLFCLAFAVVPLVTTELYPFSRAPMFADAPRRYCDYAVVTPDGRRLTGPPDLARYGLQRNYWGNPLGVGVGFEPAESADVFGTVVPPRRASEIASKHLKQLSDIPYIEVEQTVIGPTDADHVGVIGTVRWCVENPADLPGARP